MNFRIDRNVKAGGGCNASEFKGAKLKLDTPKEQNSAAFQLSPSASFAAGLFQQHLNTLLMEVATSAQKSNLAAPDTQARAFPDRLNVALSYFNQNLKNVFSWLFQSKETSNFTYSITEMNKLYLASFVAVVVGMPVEKIRGYIEELSQDQELRRHVLQIIDSGGHYIEMDRTFDFGRRLGWYAVARAIKPRVAVETGVEQGLGSLVLTSALRRNAAEGAPGQYYGTDINPQAGYLFQGEYRTHGKILYGDSIESLRALNARIDLFINDSDHSADYEAREYQTIESKLTDRAIVLGDNAHVYDRLAQFALRTGRKFLFFQEKPANHWYPGAGIGAAF